jgi:hypothetical protein
VADVSEQHADAGQSAARDASVHARLWRDAREEGGTVKVSFSHHLAKSYCYDMLTQIINTFPEYNFGGVFDLIFD